MEHNQLIDVTIIITAYNHEDYIAEAIQSAVMQAGAFKGEVIISDDGSEDSTHEIINCFRAKYPGLIIDLSSPHNCGVSANMHKCIELARGRYITFIEGDDVWIDPLKVIKQYKFLENNQNCKMCFTGCYFFDQHDGKIRIPDNQIDLPRFLTANELVGRRNPIITFSSIMVDALILKTIPPKFYDINLSEYVLAFYYERFGSVGYIPEKSVLYRQHPTSVWSSLSLKDKLLVSMEIRNMALNSCSEYAKPLLIEDIAAIKLEYLNLCADAQ